MLCSQIKDYPLSDGDELWSLMVTLVGPLSPDAICPNSRRRISSLTGGLASAGDFLIGKHHCPILPISCSFIEGTHTASLSLWCSIPVVYSTPGRNPLCNSLTHKWLLWKWLECHTQRIITFGWVPSRLYKLWKTLFQTSWKTLSQTFQKVAREKIDFWKHKCVDKSKILQSSIIGHLWSF